MVEIMEGRVGKRSVECVRCVVNNLLHLVIVKYGVISLVPLYFHSPSARDNTDVPHGISGHISRLPVIIYIYSDTQPDHLSGPWNINILFLFERVHLCLQAVYQLSGHVCKSTWRYTSFLYASHFISCFMISCPFEKL